MGLPGGVTGEGNGGFCGVGGVWSCQWVPTHPGSARAEVLSYTPAVAMGSQCITELGPGSSAATGGDGGGGTAAVPTSSTAPLGW